MAPERSATPNASIQVAADPPTAASFVAATVQSSSKLIVAWGHRARRPPVAGSIATTERPSLSRIDGPVGAASGRGPGADAGSADGDNPGDVGADTPGPEGGKARPRSYQADRTHQVDTSQGLQPADYPFVAPPDNRGFEGRAQTRHSFICANDPGLEYMYSCLFGIDENIQ
jgi:hypothetical protein